MNYREAYETWLKEFAADQATVDELKAIAGDEKEIEDRFYTELSFGTAGMRGVLGAGTNRMNLYNVRRATKGFADYINGKSEEEIRAFCLEKGLEVDDTFGKGKLIDELFGEFCEGTFIQPTFITDYPVEMSPLTKMHRSTPGLTERFELMVNGKELANAYSELNDPLDQEERFKEQMRLADKGDDEAMIIDQDFLRALQYGMPPTSGIGIGIDRLVMLMTGQTTIQEVLFFPQMKPEKKIPQSSIKEWGEIGVSEEWAYVLRKAGFNLISDIRDEKAQGLQQKIGDINKKYKLGYEKPSVNDIQAWIDAAANVAVVTEEAE